MKDLLLRCQQSIIDAELRFSDNQSSSKPIKNSSFSSSAAQLHPAVEPLGKTRSISPSDSRDSSSRDRSRNSESSDRFFGKSSSFLSNMNRKSKDRERGAEGMVILIQLVTSSFRHLSLPRSKIVSVMLLVRLGLGCNDDDVVLKRVLPSLLVALADSSSAVRSLSLRAVTALLSSVTTISPFESNLFPQYLFAPLSAISRDGETSVRVAFAECLGLLAETSKRFLETSHLTALKEAVIRAGLSPLPSQRNNVPVDSQRVTVTGEDPAAEAIVEGTTPITAGISVGTFHVEFLYDCKLKVLHDQVTRWIREVSSSSSASSSSSSASHPNSQNPQKDLNLDSSRSSPPSLTGRGEGLLSSFISVYI